MKRYILYNSEDFDDYKVNLIENALDFFTKKAFADKKHCKVNVYDPNLVITYNGIERSKTYYVVVSDSIDVPEEFEIFENITEDDECLLFKRFPTLKYETKNTPCFHDITHNFKKV